jgi:FKBP-type peptidyl-prolyl cis-trans isomerase
MAYKSKFNLKLGEKFLAKNKSNSNVKETESGLQYIIHAEGEGAKVMPEDRVLVNYKGTLLDGTEFDANDSTEFYANQVIKGWTEGLGLLGKGGKATLYIPGDLAYGERGAGRDIEPNSTLIFEVEVLDIIRPAQDSLAVEVVEAE